MSSLKIFILWLSLIGMTACSLIDPFVDRRRNAGATDKNRLYVGSSTPKEPKVCYNGLWTNDDELQALADAECQKHQTGTHAVFKQKTHFTCRLFLPSRADYQCVSTDEDQK